MYGEAEGKVRRAKDRVYWTEVMMVQVITFSSKSSVKGRRRYEGFAEDVM